MCKTHSWRLESQTLPSTPTSTYTCGVTTKDVRWYDHYFECAYILNYLFYHLKKNKHSKILIEGVNIKSLTQKPY